MLSAGKGCSDAKASVFTTRSRRETRISTAVFKAVYGNEIQGVGIHFAVSVIKPIFGLFFVLTNINHRFASLSPAHRVFLMGSLKNL